MTGKWDTSTKRLVSENPEDFVRWLIPEAEFRGPALPKPLNLNDREIEADALYEITVNGIDCLFHIEFQSYYDEDMPRRAWEYNALATFSYKRPTYTFVIYLKPCKVPEPTYEWIFPPDMLVHVFYFKVVKLWEIPSEDIKKTGLTGILPLMVLARGGKKLEVVEEVITTLQTVDGEMAHELLSLTYVIAALVFRKETDRAWLKRRFGMIDEVLKESWAYQEIRQEGVEEGRQEEMQITLQRQRALLESIVWQRFPAIVEMAKQRGATIDKPDVLQDLMLKLLTARDEAEAQDILRD